MTSWGELPDLIAGAGDPRGRSAQELLSRLLVEDPPDAEPTGAQARAGAEPREGSPGADSRVQADSRAGAAPDPGEERALEALDGAVGRLGGGPRRGQREMTSRVARAIA